MTELDEKLAVALTHKLQAVDFQTALMLKDQKGQTLTWHEQEVFPSASLIKVGIAAYVKSVWNKQPGILTEILTVQPDQRVAGAGVMHHLAQTEWSVRDVLALMLSTSDNTAANILIDRFGLTQINEWLAVTYPGLQLQRRFIAPVIDGRDNFLTAAAFLPAWQELLAGTDEYAQVCRTALHEQTERGKLVYYADDLGFSGETFNKTGDLAEVEHDCACLQQGDSWFDCLLLTKFTGPKQHQQALTLQRQVGKLLLEKLLKTAN